MGPSRKDTATAVRIRRATRADGRLLAEVGAETFFDTFAADNTPENMASYLAASFGPEIQRRELSNPHSRFFIAEVDGTAAGYVQLRFGPAPEAVTGWKPVEIARFYARKRWIGKGVGARLMRACLDEAEREGCDAVWLDVWERNPRAIAFYRRWGFRKVGAQEFRLGADVQQDWLMARPVGSSRQGTA
jgi:ribosomal protein S18 acetylase RimI-like enzyme